MLMMEVIVVVVGEEEEEEVNWEEKEGEKSTDSTKSYTHILVVCSNVWHSSQEF